MILSMTQMSIIRRVNFGNGREPKYDLREWSPDSQTMSKGITLSIEELKELKSILNETEEIKQHQLLPKET